MAQLICRGTQQQQAVCDILEKELSVHCTKLTLQQSVTSQSPDGCQARHHQLSAGHSRRSSLSSTTLFLRWCSVRVASCLNTTALIWNSHPLSQDTPHQDAAAAGTDRLRTLEVRRQAPGEQLATVQTQMADLQRDRCIQQIANSH